MDSAAASVRPSTSVGMKQAEYKGNCKMLFFCSTAGGLQSIRGASWLLNTGVNWWFKWFSQLGVERDEMLKAAQTDHKYIPIPRSAPTLYTPPLRHSMFLFPLFPTTNVHFNVFQTESGF